MDTDRLTESEKERARELARVLKEKIERYFPRPYDPSHIKEVCALFKNLEDMGFVVGWKGSFSPTTHAFEAEIVLYLPPEQPDVN